MPRVQSLAFAPVVFAVLTAPAFAQVQPAVNAAANQEGVISYTPADFAAARPNTAMDMITDRVLAARDATWADTDDAGRPLNRTLGISSLGGATLDNEENYLIKKLFTALGAIQIENQARI